MDKTRFLTTINGPLGQVVDLTTRHRHGSIDAESAIIISDSGSFSYYFIFILRHLTLHYDLPISQ